MEWFYYSTIYIMSHKIAQISIILTNISLIFQTSIYFMTTMTIITYPFWYIQASNLPWDHNLFITLLSLCRFSTERKLILYDTRKGWFTNAKLIREEHDTESLKKYSNQVMNVFVNNQLVVFQMVNVWLMLLWSKLEIYWIAPSLTMKLLFLICQQFNFWRYLINMINFVCNLNKDKKMIWFQAEICELGDVQGRSKFHPVYGLLNATIDEHLDWYAVVNFWKILHKIMLHTKNNFSQLKCVLNQ